MMPHAAADCRVMLGTVLRGNGATYYITDVIGEGGQGWVFKASYDDLDGFPVVVKVLRPDAATKDALDRFKREAEILRKLSSSNPSPYIVRFFDHGEGKFPLPLATKPGETATLPFTVLEYVHGESLQTILDRQRGQGLSIKRVRRILREVAKALEIVHAQGVVHRDLKPSNILMSSEAGREVSKVTDFGLVKIVDIRATATQSLAGVSLSYAPPEQYEPGNPRVGPATDVFSYAAIVYELLSGREAFPSTRANPFEALRLIATSRRPKLADRQETLPNGLRERPDLARRLDEVIERALDPEPGPRPQTLAALHEQIDPLLREADGGKAADPPASAATRPGHGGDVLQAIQPLSGRPPAPATHVGRALPVKDPSNARSWTWRVLAGATPGAMVRDAVIDEEANEITTLGSAGLVRWTQSGWSSLALPVGMGNHELRAIARLGRGALVFGGDGGIVAFLHAGALWDVRRYPEVDVTFHAVAADPTGQRVFAVGERTSRGHAIAVEATSSGWRRTFDINDQAPLRAVQYLDERTILACGDGGALVRIDDQGLVRIGWERTGHLRAIATRGGAQPLAFAVGTGGHALSVATHGAGRTEIEKVMTTQDLLGAHVSDDGVAWAVSANARVLRRDGAGVWKRITGDFPVGSHLMRIRARDGRVIVVGDDAAIVEGTLDRAPG